MVTNALLTLSNRLQSYTITHRIFFFIFFCTCNGLLLHTS